MGGGGVKKKSGSSGGGTAAKKASTAAATASKAAGAKATASKAPVGGVGDIEDLFNKNPGLAGVRSAAPQTRTALLAWYDANHRVLPWRGCTSQIQL